MVLDRQILQEAVSKSAEASPAQPVGEVDQYRAAAKRFALIRVATVSGAPRQGSVRRQRAPPLTRSKRFSKTLILELVLGIYNGSRFSVSISEIAPNRSLMSDWPLVHRRFPVRRNCAVGVL